LNWVGNDHKRPGIWETLALSLGILGIALMAFQGQDTSQNIDLLGIAILLIASLSWSFGSLFSRNQSMPKSSFYSVSIQMLTGGVLLFILSFSLQEAQTVEWLAITPKALWAMLYLIFFGSILAYTAYLWLLKQVNPTLASTNAFVNPVVALGLGWFFANERLSTQALFASILIVIAVVILTFKKGK
jgi:drug/metabolite transporter (DMT)-like permease